MRSRISKVRQYALGAVALTALMGTAAIADTMSQGQRPMQGQIQSVNSMPVHGAGPMVPARPDDQMQAVLDAQAKLGVKPLYTLGVDEARKQPTVADGEKELLADEHKSIEPEAVGDIENVEYPTVDDKTEKARIYKPAAMSSDEALPVVVYWHGGGWTVGTLDAYDGTPREIANGAHAVVVSCDYRNGPEDKFPTAHQDALYCYNWVTQNLKKIGGDPARIAVAGESAGGNMAAEVAIEARDRHMTMPVRQVLVYPVAGGGFDQASYKTYIDPKLPLNTQTVQYMLGQYTSSAADATNPKLDLVAQPSLQGLPPATVITAEIDPLNSEGRAYARKLMAAGVPVDFRNFPGVTHEFFGLGRTVQKAKDAEAMANADLMKSFAHQDVQASAEQP